MLDWDTVRARANDDDVFRIHARFWNATVRLGIGHRNYRMRIDDGSVRSIERWPGGVATDLAIRAPEADWKAMLTATPRPFYQDLYAAGIHHDFEVAGDATNYCAYYPAVRRLIEIMRRGEQCRLIRVLRRCGWPATSIWPSTVSTTASTSRSLEAATSDCSCSIRPGRTVGSGDTCWRTPDYRSTSD